MLLDNLFECYIGELWNSVATNIWGEG